MESREKHGVDAERFRLELSDAGADDRTAIHKYSTSASSVLLLAFITGASKDFSKGGRTRRSQDRILQVKSRGKPSRGSERQSPPETVAKC